MVTHNALERVEFADGTFWTSADIAATGLSQVGTATVETLTGWSGNDIIHGRDGNDTLSGGAGAKEMVKTLLQTTMVATSRLILLHSEQT